MLLVQLREDKNPIGRIDAAHTLGRRGGHRNIDALREALLKDAFWGVRAEAARALGLARSEEAATVLIHLLDVVDHPKVRRAIYEGLRAFKSSRIAVDIEKRVGTEKSYFAQAEALRAIGQLGHPRSEQILKGWLEKESWNDVIRIAALDGLALSRSTKHVPLFIDYTKPGHHHRLRMAAVRALISLGAGVDRVQRHLIELLGDSFLLVQMSAVRGLQSVGDERAVPALKKLTSGDLDGRLMRAAEEAIDKITKGFE
jgi:aminopeptidase N